MKTIRTFLAIPLPTNIAGAAGKLIVSTRFDGDGIKWVPVDNLHLTLKFLGEVDNVETPDVCTALESICEPMQPFDLNFLGTGGLPDAERARVLTVRIDDPSGQLVQLAANIDDRFAEMGYKREPRDYRPHLTLGRARANARRANEDVVKRWLEHAGKPLGEMRVDHVQVVGSFLEKRGPVYNIMDTIDL
ncbi:MAG: RNA 2',3'-cyclic phosphodiesterase [Planctomycetota bacterium]